jgi:hypothetical protein
MKHPISVSIKPAAAHLLVSAPGVDAAILDIQLGDHSSVPIAEALHSKGLPFAFASGYGASGAPQGFEDYPVL